MKKLSIVFSSLLALAMVLAACSGGAGANGTTTPGLPNTGASETPGAGTSATPMTGATTEAPVASEAPMTTQAPATTLAPTSAAEATAAPSATGAVTSTLRGAQILPPNTGRKQLILLSNWMGFKLVDKNQKTIGQVQDYIINMCEAHVLYMVVDTGASASSSSSAPATQASTPMATIENTPMGTQSSGSSSSQSGSLMLVPFEAVTVNGGSLNADTKTITLNLDASQISGAPALSQKPDLSSNDREGQVRDFWSGVLSLSKLDTTCSVAPAAAEATQSPSTTPSLTKAVKLAYASNLLKATLQDGNQNTLGQVQDALVEPESGQLFYLAIQRQKDNALTLTPMGAVNVPQNAHQQAGQLNLVLLVDTSAFEGAPAISSLDSLNSNVNPEAKGYWSQYMGR